MKVTLTAVVTSKELLHVNQNGHGDVCEKTLTGKVPSFSLRKVSIFLRPFSSTDAQMDQMRLKVNQSSTTVPRFSLSAVLTLNKTGI